MKNGHLASGAPVPTDVADLRWSPSVPTLRAPQTSPLHRERPSCGTEVANEQLDRAMHAAIATFTAGLSPAALWLAVQDWLIHLTISPGKGLALTSQMAQAFASWTISPMAAPVSACEREASKPALLANQDPRFAASVWSEWPFSQYRDRFLEVQAWWHAATTGVPGVHVHHTQIVEFLARQLSDVQRDSAPPKVDAGGQRRRADSLLGPLAVQSLVPRDVMKEAAPSLTAAESKRTAGNVETEPVERSKRKEDGRANEQAIQPIPSE
ncbi:poly-beta-hydroxybutyrate polymerase N-terminal domain-containing protein [Paraburkholderia graminis]|uniref:poly-beta-hydroxybutyrate polymerase N-terminal domain-containing protein n=1 Tax=Paraburkholderia graminis TaxID=60548 RepID=UPI0038BDBA3A